MPRHAPQTHTVADLRAAFVAHLDPGIAVAAAARWERHGPRLLDTLRALYGSHPHFVDMLPTLIRRAAEAANARPEALREQDLARERDPRWFLGPGMVGYSAYVDRFAGTLRGVASRVSYLQDLGIRYLHLLPFQQAREGDSDGGFAVRDYDRIDPALGTLDDLQALTATLREAGISLCADFVLNHTSDDHRWALAARSGDRRYTDYYLAYPDRTLPDRHEQTLGQVFPQTAPGNFTHVQGMGWVWTTFYPYQWDLNWANPDVFADMAATLLRMANRGIEAFRLDSTAYLWKREGTASINQPEAHAILQALHALVGMVAPGVLLKAEAIVPIRELPPYFGSGEAIGRECHLAYHSSLMAAAWAALAAQRGDILARVVEQTPALPGGCAWITYVRCHDDIGWGVLAEEAVGDARNPGFDLASMASFYAGETPGSYARGRAFQGNAGAGHGSNGMSSALVGIEAALASGDAAELELAERRLLLLHGIAFTAAGIPLLYMGDELALGNDYRFDASAPGAEGRWLHRPPMPWSLLDGPAATGAAAVAARIRTAMQAMIRARRATDALAADAPMRALETGDPALLALARGEGFLALFNLGARHVRVDALAGVPDREWLDVLGNAPVRLPLRLAPYSMRWLRKA